MSKSSERIMQLEIEEKELMQKETTMLNQEKKKVMEHKKKMLNRSMDEMTKQPNFCSECGKRLDANTVLKFCPECRSPVKHIAIGTTPNPKVGSSAQPSQSNKRHSINFSKMPDFTKSGETLSLGKPNCKTSYFSLLFCFSSSFT